MRKRKTLAVVVALCVTGCGHQETRTPEIPEASTITYRLPETHVKVDAILTLKSCVGLKVKADVGITPLAAASDPDQKLSFELRGSQLKSFWEKRDLSIELYPHGAVKAVNATTADKTASIVGGVIKLATTLAALGAQEGAEPADCNTQTSTAMTRHTDLQTEIVTLRKQLKSSSDREKLAKQIEALAQEVARLETGELQIKLSETIQVARKSYFTNGQADGELQDNGIIRWNRGKFSKWLESDKVILDNCKKSAKSDDEKAKCGKKVQEGSVGAFALNYCISRDISDENKACSGKTAQPWEDAANILDDKETDNFTGVAYLRVEKLQCASDTDSDNDTDTNGGHCPTTFVLRDPVPARMIVSAASANYEAGVDSTLARKDIPVAQWGALKYLDLSAGFGEEKTVSFSLDEFGRKTKFGWSSNAGGEGIVSGASSIVEPYSAYRTARDGEDLASMKARVDELETKQKLNKLENCRSILANGGFVCPEE